MLQNVLENESEQADKTLSSCPISQEGKNPSSLYSISLLLIIGLALKGNGENETLGSGVAIDDQYKKEILSLLLESRPAIVESAESTKPFGGRFGATGFGSRGGRGGQRGRVFSGQIGGTGRRSIIRQPNENLWDMPCSEMTSMTLGDIREAENKMKAEDLTLDQYVERQKESNDRKSSSFSQSNQKKNFVSIPISGETPINVSNTFSLNNGSAKDYQIHISSNVNGNFHNNSGQSNNQHGRHHNNHNNQQHNRDSFMNRLGQSGTLNSHNNTNNHQNSTTNQANNSVNLKSGLIGGEKTQSSSVFSTNISNRKSSSISETFLNGPANLSLFDVNTPIFDDDNNDAVVDFRPPMIKNANTVRNGFEESGKSKGISEQLVRGQTQFENGIQVSASNFSWLNRNGNTEEVDKSISNNISDNSTSFPALSKNSQFSQSQVKVQNNNHSLMSSEQSILQKLHAAGIASKLVDKNIIDNIDNRNLNHNNYFESKFKQNISNTNEYPPLSSASNMVSSSLSYDSNNLKFNNQLKSNDAGRLLMSIIGAGQQNNNNNKNYVSNFNIRNNTHRIHTHNTHNSHNSNHHNNVSHHSGHIGNFSRY
ncbi:unnamed protein product [Cryptosporidium hominis]|uniref:Uncharacterized protein n=1 Tax=Cryptosporidium hominis TaxID=237895 RepID=A0A0S4TF18_CRYHO|nr:hypothetical protein ChTU502y2012_394g0035 [Cryptosporidium hominis]PPA65695.1 hypothetical protein ChUKH1_00775 [Cryptosporidium hominis]CUV06001.1 unnamed protein product [Cryptosporidium hominis]